MFRMCNEMSPGVFISIILFFIVSLSGSNYYVRILSTIDRELLKPNASVALHKHSNALVDVLPPEADSSIMMLTSGKHSALLYPRGVHVFKKFPQHRQPGLYLDTTFFFLFLNDFFLFFLVCSNNRFNLFINSCHFFEAVKDSRRSWVKFSILKQTN